MKKIFLVFLCLMLICTSLSACGSDNSETTAESPTVIPMSVETTEAEQMVGAWEIKEDLKEIKLPSAIADTFKEARDDLKDDSLKPLALVASMQGTGQMRYAIVCRQNNKLVMAFVKKPEGKHALLEKVKEINFNGKNGEDYAETDDEKNGWILNKEYNQGELTEEEKDIFSRATSGFIGAKLSPIAVLKTQVVAGINYAYLGTQTLDESPDKPALVVVSIYKDLDGNTSINDIISIHASDYDK